MHYNKQDIIEAWYLALSTCCVEKLSNEYKRLCGMQRYYKPIGRMTQKSLTENGLAIYNQTVKNLNLNRSYF